MTKNKITSRDDLIMEPLTEFYSKDKNLNYILPIVQGKSKVSLRLLDWFVTNYCKKYNITISKNLISHDYKSQLRAFSKKQFDPFCRRNRITFEYKNGEELITTVGQLNFFKWAIESNIIEYVKDNINDIQNDMNASAIELHKKNATDENGNKIRRKRRSLSISASKMITKQDVTITVSFD